MATDTLPVLPLEVIDTIMEIAVDTLDPKSVSSITLLSHHCRIIANKKRFFYIGGDSKTKTSSTDYDILATLIEEAAGYAMRGIHTFIAHVDIIIQEDCRARQMQVYIAIWNQIFRDDAILHTPVRKLEIRTTYFAKLQDRHPAMEPSLRSLIKESHINALELHSTTGLPFDLLWESKIEHLSLSWVGGWSVPDIVSDRLVPVYLKSLNIVTQPIGSFEVLDLLILLGGPKFSPLQYLTKLTLLTVCQAFPIELIEQTKRLETLSLNCCEEAYKVMADRLNPGGSLLSSRQFIHLKSLDLHYKLHAQSPSPSGPLAVCVVGNSLPPQLEKLYIKGSLDDTIRSTLTAPDYGLLDDNVLLKEAVSWDDNLSSAVSRRTKKPAVQIDLSIRCTFKKEDSFSCIWKDHWRQKFESAFWQCRSSLTHFSLSIHTSSALYEPWLFVLRSS
ncbi:hypothetical protein JR316_0012739 [Psilocybe cubensis]|uniref:Uncharacterized protein n=2 Tax=Psilocybe cubensis TaxID=181762 RepID=A0ACB8GJQ2_PSICU|nr:hypothetical protein JR316_0012739 [Psilocybe cubensis]KAH9475622.1 hypothetical protein JR316_0012739 [Psilocybe cubensis]